MKLDFLQKLKDKLPALPKLPIHKAAHHSVDGPVLGIDISTAAIKMVQVSKKNGRAVLDTYGELALGPYMQKEIGESVNIPADNLVQAMKDLMIESNITSRECGVSIPMSSSLIKIIKFPNLPEDKLKNMIPLEVRKYIPVPLEEVLLDWWTLPPSDEDGAIDSAAMIDVLVVAIHNEVIKKLEAVVNGANLRSSFSEIEIFSTLRSVVDDSNMPVVVCDIGTSHTKIYITENQLVRASHVISRGSEQVTEAIAESKQIAKTEAEILKRENRRLSSEVPNVNSITGVVVRELERAVRAFEQSHQKKIQQVILTGGGALSGDFVSAIQDSFGDKVKLADPFSRLDADENIRDILRDAGPEFSVAVGVALRKLNES